MEAAKNEKRKRLKRRKKEEEAARMSITGEAVTKKNGFDFSKEEEGGHMRSECGEELAEVNYWERALEVNMPCVTSLDQVSVFKFPAR